MYVITYGSIRLIVTFTVTTCISFFVLYFFVRLYYVKYPIQIVLIDLNVFYITLTTLVLTLWSVVAC